MKRLYGPPDIAAVRRERAGARFHVPPRVCTVAEYRQEMGQAGIKRPIVLGDQIAAPEVAPDLLAREELIGTSREKGQQAVGLRSQPDSLSAFPSFRAAGSAASHIVFRRTAAWAAWSVALIARTESGLNLERTTIRLTSEVGRSRFCAAAEQHDRAEIGTERVGGGGNEGGQRRRTGAGRSAAARTGAFMRAADV